MIKPLIGVRGFAATWVVLYHFRLMIAEAFPGARLFRSVVESGFLGVDLFAILSGFVIAMTYASELSRLDVRKTVRFLLLRLARIYPLLIFSLATLWFARAYSVGMKGGLAALSDSRFWMQLFMLNGWGLESEWAWNVPSWSVSSEWLCYLLFPFAAPLLVRVREGSLALVFAAITILGTAAAMTVVGYPEFDAYLDWGALRIGGEFLTGCFLFRAYESGIGRGLPWGVLGSGSFLAAIAVSPYSGRFTVFLFVVVVYALAQSPRLLERVFGNPVCVFWGEISYSVYLMHWFVVTDVDRLFSPLLVDLPIIARLVVLLGVVFGLSTLTYLYVERPSRALLRRQIG